MAARIIIWTYGQCHKVGGRQLKLVCPKVQGFNLNPRVLRILGFQPVDPKIRGFYYYYLYARQQRKRDAGAHGAH